MRSTLLPAHLVLVLLGACGGEKSEDLPTATRLDARAVYLVEEGSAGTRLVDLEGSFAFDGAPPRMVAPTIHPLRSAIRYAEFSGAVFMVDIELGRSADPVAMETDCDRGLAGSRLDAETGALVYACLEASSEAPEFQRGEESLPSCEDTRGPLVVAGERVLCERTLIAPSGRTPLPDGVLLETARRAGDRFLGVVSKWPDDARLVAIDDAGRATELHSFAPPPAEHGGRSLYFLPGLAALSAHGTLYRSARLDDPNLGDRIIYAFDEASARPVSSPIPAVTKIALATGP